MTNDRQELLDDALCLMDEELLSRVIAMRPPKEGRRAHRSVTVFGRKMPAMLSSVVAVGILLMCVAAVPGVIRLVQLLAGINSPPPTPPVGGSEYDTETGEDHIHNWSPWVPWGDSHERHCQVTECEKQEWEPHQWSFTRAEADGMLFHCEKCSEEQKQSADSSRLLQNLPEEGIVSLELAAAPGFSPKYDRVIASAENVDAILALFRDAAYAPYEEVSVIGGFVGTMTFRYTDGRTVELQALNPGFAVKDENGCLWWQYLSYSDADRLDELLTPEECMGTLLLGGVLVDCGANPPVLRRYPMELGTATVAILPLMSTLRALGAEVGELVNGEADIVYRGKSYRLSIPAQTLCAAGSTVNLIAIPSSLFAKGPYTVEAGSDELMVDMRILFQHALPAMAGGTEWQAWADYKEETIRMVVAHEHRYGEILRHDEFSHAQPCEESGCPGIFLESHTWVSQEVQNGVELFVCPLCGEELWKARDDEYIPSSPSGT